MSEQQQPPAFDLMASLEKPTNTEPTIITVVAEQGMGKTTLGATFPAPVFMRFEKGTETLAHNEVFDHVQVLPVIERVGQEMEQLKALITQEHPFKTLVVDTITAQNTLYESYVVATDPKKPKSINQAGGGYGAGYAQVAAMHQLFRERCGTLNKLKGMNIVFLAHADTVDVELPDTDKYMKYSLRMNKKSLPHYTDNVSLVGHLRQVRFVQGGDAEKGIKGKITSTEGRTITCYPVASSITKNRYGITKDLPVKEGENPFIDYIPALQG